MRELLARRVLGDIVWIDTRDMSADGLTKGAVSRELLHQVMDGSMNIHHKTEQWKPKVVEPPKESFVRTFFTYESQLTEVCVSPQLFAFSSSPRNAGPAARHNAGPGDSAEATSRHSLDGRRFELGPRGPRFEPLGRP